MHYQIEFYEPGNLGTSAMHPIGSESIGVFTEALEDVAESRP